MIISTCIWSMMESTPMMLNKEQKPSKYTEQLFDCGVQGKIQLLQIPETCDEGSEEGEINRQVTAVKSPPMVKHQEGEISEAPVSELHSSLMLKQWENSLQYPFFRHASRSRLDLRDCLQAGCLQGGD